MFLRKREPDDDPSGIGTPAPAPRRPWLRVLWIIPVGWALSLVGLYFAAYVDPNGRLGGLMFAGPVFTIVGVYSSIKGYRGRNKTAKQ